MNGIMDIRHPVSFAGTWYGEDQRAQLHRYLDPDFVGRFEQTLLQGDPTLNLPQPSDRFASWDEAIVLRLPVHRNFYLVSTEIVCDRTGYPALDPARIASAGFVLRRVGGAEELAWMLEDGRPVGWSTPAGELRDPDLNRRMRRNGVLCDHAAPPAYSGEETHPLHPTTVRDGAGKLRTVLFGYLPLGGFHYRDETSFSAADLSRSLEKLSADWPFSLESSSRLHRWRDSDAEQVVNGVPTRAFAQFLRSLVFRYQVAVGGRLENAALEALLDRIHFLSLPRERDKAPETLGRQAVPALKRFMTYRQQSLLDYLGVCAGQPDNPLVAYFTAHADKLQGSGVFPPLPDGRGGTLNLSLLLSEADAQEVRHVLRQRTQQALETRVTELPVPKFLQGEEDLYQVVPFARVRDDRGDERVVWSESRCRSEPFRVAAPFDPEASRPSLIQMPSLKDLKRGLAKGASFSIPPDLAHLMDSLKKEKGLTDELLDEPPGPPPPGGLQTICSLSIPIVTVAAMIVLMVVVSILDFFLRWMPYLIQCLPIPGSNDKVKFP